MGGRHAAVVAGPDDAAGLRRDQSFAFILPSSFGTAFETEIKIWFISIRMPVRRLHDMNLSGAFVAFAWLGLWPGTKGRNSYGADPRGPRDRDLAQVFDGPPIVATRTVK